MYGLLSVQTKSMLTKDFDVKFSQDNQSKLWKKYLGQAININSWLMKFEFYYLYIEYSHGIMINSSHIFLNTK